jgi:hypothetical protein
MRRQLLSFGLVALVSCGLFSATGAFAQDRGAHRGPGPDAAVVNRTDLLRRMDPLYLQIRDLDPAAHGASYERDERDRHDRDERDNGRRGFDVRGNDAAPQARLSGSVHDAGRRPDVRPDPRLTAALASLAQLRDAVARAPSFAPTPLPRAMDQYAFQRLLLSVRTASFSSDKADVICDAARGGHIDSEQAYALVALVPFSSDQVNAAVALYERVVDPENFYRVYDALRFPSTKAELRKRLRLDR